MKKLFSIFLLFFASSAIFSEKAKIEFRLNLKSDDKTNYLKWSAENTSYKDYFDVVSGASKFHSTSELNLIQFDSSKKSKATPKGLKSLLLFAVSDFKYINDDGLKISEENNQIKLEFIHRGNAYKIISDDKGFLHINDTDFESFFIAENVMENKNGVFTNKEELTRGFIPPENKNETADTEKNGDKSENKEKNESKSENKDIQNTPAEENGDIIPEKSREELIKEIEKLTDEEKKDLDWEKFDFILDSADESSYYSYTGNLKITYLNDILQISGILTKKITPAIDDEKTENSEEEDVYTNLFSDIKKSISKLIRKFKKNKNDIKTEPKEEAEGENEEQETDESKEDLTAAEKTDNDADDEKEDYDMTQKSAPSKASSSTDKN